MLYLKKVRKRHTQYCVCLFNVYFNQFKAQRSGFELERKKETADMQLSWLFRKPRKRNAAGFF